MHAGSFMLIGLMATAVASALSGPDPLQPHTVIGDRATDWSADGATGRSEEAQISWNQRVLRPDQRQRDLVMTIVNHADERRCIAVEHRFRFDGLDHFPFVTGIEPLPAWPEDGQITYAYVREKSEWMHMGVPFASLLRPDGGAGVSFSADLGDHPILPFEVRMWRDREQNATFVSIRRPQVRLEANGSNRVSLHVAAHGADWREGLAWIRDRWPRLFTVPDGTGKYQWCFWGGMSFFEGAYELTVKNNPLKRGIVNSRPRPWFGLNMADWEPWLISVDQKYYLLSQMDDIPGRPGQDATVEQIREFVEGLEPDEELVARLREQKEAHQAWRWMFLTHEKVRTAGRRLIEDGFTWHYYWNASETWRYWSKENYAESLYYPLSQDFWTDSTVLDPFPGSRRAADLVADAKRVFDTYPQCSGLFLDQVYYALDNRKDGFDDGVSVTPKGKPFSRHQWNTYRVLRDIRQLADERGKAMHANFIFNSLEIASLTEFGLVEGMQGLQRISWFYDIGNRMHICQTTTEQANQQAVLLGWQTNLFSVPGLDAADRRQRPWFNRLWRPIQMMLQERSFVLEPNCLTLPAGFEGNVFRRPDGNFVVPVVSPGVSHLSPYEWADLSVVVRIAEAARVRRVYQISTDRLGPVALEFEHKGRELRFRIPRHRSVSMLVLAVGGKFVALRDQTVGPRGGSVEIVFDDLDQDERTVRALDVSAPPEGSVFVTVQPQPVPDAVLPNPQWEMDRKPDFELRVADTVEVTLGPDPSLVDQPHDRDVGLLLQGRVSLAVGDEAAVQAALHNHGDAPRTLALSMQADGLDVEPRSAQVTVGPGACKVVELRVRGRRAGKSTLTADAGAARAQLEIDVFGDRLDAADIQQVRSARLLVDSVANGPIDEQITLNGVPAGKLVQRIGQPVWDRRAAHELSEEAAAALETAGNIVEVDTGERKFAIARPVLEIELNDGTRVRLRTPDPTQSTPPAWLQAQGRRVESGEKMRWTFP